MFCCEERDVQGAVYCFIWREVRWSLFKTMSRIIYLCTVLCIIFTEAVPKVQHNEENVVHMSIQEQDLAPLYKYEETGTGNIFGLYYF